MVCPIAASWWLATVFGALLDGIGEWSFRHQRIDKTATERFGCPLKRIERYVAVRFGLFKLHDPRLRYPKPAGVLSGGHTERVSDGTEPTFGGRAPLVRGRIVAKRLSRWWMASFI